MREGPGCRHELCLFERHCLVTQAETELLDSQADRARREERSAVLALASGLSLDEGPLWSIAVYSSDRKQRIRAGELLSIALGRIADGKVA